MAIKAVVTAEEHAKLDPALKALYKAEGDKFILDADGIDGHPAAASLKRALDTERNNASTTARELKELKDKLGDLSPEEAVDARRRIREIEDAQRVGDIPEKFKQKFDEAVAARVESMEKNFNNQKKGFEKQITDLNEKLNATTGQLEALTIDGEVRSVASRLGLQDWAVEDAIMHARGVYRVKDGKPVPMKGDQIIFSGKKPGDPKPIEEWLGEKVTEKPGWLKPNGGSGADKTNRTGNAGGGFVISREQARDPNTYQRMKEEAKKAGQELQIAAE